MPSIDEELSKLSEQTVIDTPALDRLQQTSLPFRGERRQKVLKRVRYQIKNRRTPKSVGQRVSNITIAPLTDAIDQEARAAVQDNVQNILERSFGDDN